jgi:molybdenum cofactor guanylyltransferase
MNFSAVILAGGKSSRMGQDKAWLQIDGESLLTRQIRLARKVGACEVLISGRMDTDYSALGCQVLHDRFVDAGPLAGIECALAATSSPLLLVLAVDMPKMQAQLLRQLLSQCSERAGVIPRMNTRIEPLAAFYTRVAGSLIRDYFPAAIQAKFGSEISYANVKAPSVTAFADRCVASGVAQFADLSENEAHFFANWNSPEQVEHRGLA